jgi:hypothetical protein
MKKWIVVLGCILIVGCGKLFGGPSEEDVNVAMQAIMRGFQASVTAEPEMQEVYSNAADMTFTLYEGALVHELSFVINDDGSLKTTGTCTYDEYRDKSTNYLMTGELTYHLVFASANRPDDMHGEMDLVFEMEGGKIETLEVFFAVDEQGQLEDAQLLANGQEVDFQRWQKVFNLLDSLVSKNPG